MIIIASELQITSEIVRVGGNNMAPWTKCTLGAGSLKWILLLSAMIFLIEMEVVHGWGHKRTATVRGCTNETVYLSNDWRTYRDCCSLLYPNTPCQLAPPCRNGGVKSQDGARCDCQPGWRGVTCLMQCARGFHGQGCERRCKCGQGADCDPMTGVCSCLDRNRCVSRCRNNYYGSTCQHRCNCRNGCQCDADTGQCLCRSRPPRNRVSSPANLYHPTMAQAGFLNVCGGECMNGGTCKTNGVCRCRSGFTGTFCDNTCRPGTYGRNCQERCQCSSSARCLPETGLCTCPGYTSSQSSQSGGNTDSEDEDESDSEYDGDSSASDIDEVFNSPSSSSSSYSMYHCTGRCPVGRYGPYCRQTCNCPAGLMCNDVSGNCECPHGEVCDGSGYSGTTTDRGRVVPTPPRRRLPVPVAPAANPPRGPGRGSGTAPAASGPRTGTDTSTSSHSVSTTGNKKYPAVDPNDGTITSKAAKPEIALQGGGDTVTSEERLGRGETLTLWAVIAVSSLLLLVVASVLIGLLIKRQYRGSTVHVEGTQKKRLEDTNVYEIVESTNGRYRSNSKSIDKLAKKARERAESFKAQDSISSITKEIYLLRTSSLSNMTTLNPPKKDHKATEFFANWANSLRLNKSSSSLNNEGSSSPGSSRSRSSSNTVTQPYVNSKTVTLDNDFDDYAEPVDHVSTLSKDFPPKRPLTVTNSDSRCSDRGYQSLYTSSSSNASSNRTSAVYKPTEDSDYDELEEESVDRDKTKQFRFTRSYTYTAPSAQSEGKNGEYSCLNRGANTGNKRGQEDKPTKTSRGNNGYSSAVKTAETDGEYSHLNRSAKRHTQIPSKRVHAPTLRHDDEDDYDYLEAHKTDKTNGSAKKDSVGKAENGKNIPKDGEYDLLHRQFRARNDQYESIWPGKK